MEYIVIKNSDLKVSRLCMGGCPMGGYGWGNVSDEDTIKAVHTAIDMGITMFDTADTYGLGKSEKLLGAALGQNRKEIVIATKFGVRIQAGKTFYDNSPKWIETAVNNSLKRLKTDYIDLYQIHYRDEKTPISVVVETLEKLKKEGKIRYYGLSNIHKEDIPELEKYIGLFISFQDEYSLACRKNEKDIFQLSQNLQLTPFTWGSLGQGILTGKYKEGCTFGKDDRRSKEIYTNFHGEKFLKNLKIVKVIKEIADEIMEDSSTPISVSSVAIRFILDYINNSIVLAGMKNSKQVRDNCKAVNWKLSNSQLKRLELISRD